jgi:hypothetical protein
MEENMVKKAKTLEARNLEKIKAKISETQESLQEIIIDMEKQLSKKIVEWNAKDVRKLYKNYSMYCIIDDLVQVINKALNRF